MKYFKHQEELIQLFEAIAPIANEYRIVYIIVDHKHQVKQLQDDLSQVLSTRGKIEKTKNGITIKGSAKMKGNKLVIVNKYLDVERTLNEKGLEGIPTSQQVYAGADND